MKKITLIILVSLLYSLQVFPQQQTSRNGFCYYPQGELRIFLVFADVVDDPDTVDVPFWPKDSLPYFKDIYLDVSTSTIPEKTISSYFHEASFGQMSVIGNYYPELICLHYDEIESYEDHDGTISTRTVLKILDGKQSGNNFSFDYFDQYTIPSGSYLPKIQASDGYIDLMVIIWRHNSKYKPHRNGGNTSISPMHQVCKNMNGVNRYMNICIEGIEQIFIHELGHTLIGNNNFHSGGAGDGSGTFLSNCGGYSMLSSFNRNLPTYNAWDRWWLGWINPDKSEEISAMTISGNEIETDFIYGDDIGDGLFILRDFAQYGDAIRIQLPHIKDLNSDTKQQYLWIENRQLCSKTEKYDRTVPRGIRMNLQIGNDTIYFNHYDYYKSRTNYYMPISAFGNYDYEHSSVIDFLDGTPVMRDALTSSSSLKNPLTGYSPLLLPAYDLNNDNYIYTKEYCDPWKTFIDGVQCLGDNAYRGNNMDSYTKGKSISISSNPPSLPVLTYNTYDRYYGNDINPQYPSIYDNRYVYLNGLRVDVVDERPDGSVLVRISWDDYRVCDNVRWCGPIVLSDEIDLLPSYSIVLDQGLTPTQPKIIDNLGLFAKPTVLHCRRQSTFTQREGSKVVVKNNSTLLIDTGAVYEILDGAKLEIEPSGCLIVRSGASLSMRGTGRVVIDSGAYLCVEDSNSINISGSTGAIYLEDDYILGSNQVSGYASTNCLSTINISTSGRFRDLQSPSDRYIQNLTYTAGNHLETGGQINAGYDITTAVSNGYVVVPSGASVTMESETGVSLQEGVRVEQGGTLRIR